MVNTVDVDLPVDVFDAQTNIPLIHQVVVAQLAAARQGTHSTKTRGEVAGGGKKPYRQKGTGRARQGSIRAPQYAGGGIVHGPQPRDYSQRTNKKMKAAALRGALSDRVRTGRLHVVDALVTGDVPSTKAAAAALRELTGRPRVLVVVEREDAITAKSLRNISGAAILTFDQLNTYDVLLSDDVIFTQAAYEAFVAARSIEGSATVKLSAAAVEVTAPAAGGESKKAGSKKAGSKKAGTKKAGTKKVGDSESGLVGEQKAESDSFDATVAKPLTAAEVVADANDTAEVADAGEPYGAGSKGATKSGKAPKGYDIKGNADSMKYHLPDGQWYDATVAEVWFDSEESAKSAGFTKAGSNEVAESDQPSDTAETASAEETPANEVTEAPANQTESPDAADQPYGAGSKGVTESGEAPAGYAIKGNADSMKYHLPDGQWYDATIAEVWFDTEESAQAAGFTKAGS